MRKPEPSFAGLEMKQASRNPRTRPPATELAAELRAGETLTSLAAKYGTTRHRISSDVAKAGFTHTGENAAKKAAPRRSIALVYEPEPEEWRDQAACLGQADRYEDNWHPDGWGLEAKEDAAKAICGGCPVREVCLAYALRVDALTEGPSWGVWGGLNAKERDKLRRRTA